MTLRSLLMAGVFTMAAGCAGDSTDGANDTIVGPIDYELTGGFVPGKSMLHIDTDGTFVRTPIAGTPDGGTLGSAELANLRDKVEAVDFAALDAVYASTTSDDRIHTLSVERDGTVHTVQADETAAMPDRLEALLAALHDMTVTDR